MPAADAGLAADKRRAGFDPRRRARYGLDGQRYQRLLPYLREKALVVVDLMGESTYARRSFDTPEPYLANSVRMAPARLRRPTGLLVFSGLANSGGPETPPIRAVRVDE